RTAAAVKGTGGDRAASSAPATIGSDIANSAISDAAAIVRPVRGQRRLARSATKATSTRLVGGRTSTLSVAFSQDNSFSTRRKLQVASMLRGASPRVGT